MNRSISDSLKIIRSLFHFHFAGEQEHGQIVDKLLALEARVEHWIREISKVDLWHHNAK